MATIIAVHGTFATGEESGDKWWQKTSECEKGLREFVQGNATPLNYESLIWDGDNSETSRRAAGRRLLQRMGKLEAAGEPYVVIGHSHGGSVVAFAMQLAARHGNALPHLRSWITVGTPFFASERKQLLYARIDQLSKGIFFIGAIMAIAIGVHVWNLYGDSVDAVTKSLAVLAAAAATWWILGRLGPQLEGGFNDWELLADQHVTAVDRTFGGRWLQLWHPDDEAILLLRTVHDRRPGLFPEAFAGPYIYLAGLYLLLPLLMLVLASSSLLTRPVAYVLRQPAVVGTQATHAPAAQPASAEQAHEPDPVELLKPLPQQMVPMSNWFTNVDTAKASFAERFAMLALAIPVLMARALEGVRAYFSSTFIGIYLPALGAAMLVMVACTIMLLQWLAARLSGKVVDGLNAITAGQMCGLLSGADVGGERASGCNVRPFWSNITMASLPTELSAEIAAISDAAAAKAVGSIRGRAAEIAASADFKQRIAQYLTWDELLHTTYFKSPRFLRLLAYAISRVDGFAPTAALLADPHYGQMRQWLEEIQRSARAEVSATARVPLASPLVS